MICYKDLITIYEVVPDEYGNDKIEIDSGLVDCLFLQSVGFNHSSFRDNVDSDSTAFLNPLNSFVAANAYRLEGFYVKAEMFGSASDESWYKITAVAVNKDALGCNNIDNVEIALKKTRKVPGSVS